MDQTAELAIVIATAVALFSALLIVLRQRREADELTRESQFAVSTEGEKRCQKCGMGNLWTDATCVTCGAKLRG